MSQQYISHKQMPKLYTSHFLLYGLPLRTCNQPHNENDPWLQSIFHFCQLPRKCSTFCKAELLKLHKARSFFFYHYPVQDKMKIEEEQDKKIFKWKSCLCTIRHNLHNTHIVLIKRASTDYVFSESWEDCIVQSR
jgi:hypothetical protein